jgi:lysophospholipase L1-like esterase
MQQEDPMKIVRVGRLVMGNAVVLVVMLAVLNLLSLVVIEGYLFSKKTFAGPAPLETRNEWWSLPVYTDKEASRALFRDFSEIDSHYVPFLAWSRSTFRGVSTTVDPEGDRVHVPPSWDGEVAGVVRFFGGSTMWGTGAPDQGTIPAIYNEFNPQWTVHNHGESGYNSRQSLDRLITLVSTGAPMDVVVFYEGANELFNCQVGEVGPTHGRVARLRALTGPQPPADNFFNHLGAVARTLLLNRTTDLATSVMGRLPPVGTVGTEIKRWDCDDNPRKAAGAATILLRNWEMAQVIAESQGVRFIGVLQPAAHVGSPELDHVRSRLRNDVRANHRVLYPALQARLREAGHEWIYDLTDAFDGIGAVLIDDFHVTEEGNRVIARRIHEILSANRS